MAVKALRYLSGSLRWSEDHAPLNYQWSDQLSSLGLHASGQELQGQGQVRWLGQSPKAVDRHEGVEASVDP